MQQEFLSVSVNGALELSSFPSSASSSSQSSPDNNSSIPSPPILPPPLLLPIQPAEPSCSIVIAPAPAISTAAACLLSREQALKSLKESIPHSMTWRQLQKSERAHHKDASWHKKAVRRLSKELYWIVSIYALLQGVLFAAVAQSSVFTCADWWGPVGIASAITLGTISGTLDKLCRMGQQKQEVKKFERRQRAVYDKIEQLQRTGSACSLETLEPAHTEAVEPQPGMVCIFSAQGLLVLGFLAGFSLLIMASCLVMLCSSCHCSE